MPVEQRTRVPQRVEHPQPPRHLHRLPPRIAAHPAAAAHCVYLLLLLLLLLGRCWGLKLPEGAAVAAGFQQGCLLERIQLGCCCGQAVVDRP